MCDPRLVRLLSGARVAQAVTRYNAADPIPGGSWFALLSLPLWHRTRMDSVPYSKGYLVAEPPRVQYWRTRIPQDGCRVGLVWAGNRAAEKGHLVGRSPPLAALAPLSAVPGVQFLSLQKGTDESAEHPLGTSLLRWPELDAGPDAFVDTAAILTLVDLLVTTDTSIAHLAGALGVNTWLCLHHDPDARWMMQGERTPWYSSMRIFRQPARGDWPGLFARVAAELSRGSVAKAIS